MDSLIALSKINELVWKWDSLNNYELQQALEVQERWMWHERWRKGNPVGFGEVKAEFLHCHHLWTQHPVFMLYSCEALIHCLLWVLSPYLPCPLPLNSVTAVCWAFSILTLSICFFSASVSSFSTAFSLFLSPSLLLPSPTFSLLLPSFHPSSQWHQVHLGITMGNPGVFPGNLYPYLSKPTPMTMCRGFHRSG